MSKQAGYTKGRRGEKQLKFKAKCDKCGKEFYPREKELAILKGCIIIRGFECRCGAQYVTIVTDNKLRREMSQLQDLLEELKKIQYSNRYEISEQIKIHGFVPQDIQDRVNKKEQDYLDTITQLKRDIAARGKLLKDKYKGYIK